MTGTRGHQGHTHFAGGTSKAVSGMNSGLLMSDQHMLNGVLFVKSVVNVKNSTAGIAPNVLNILGLKGFDEDFCTTQFLCVRRLIGLFGFV